MYHQTVYLPQLEVHPTKENNASAVVQKCNRRLTSGRALEQSQERMQGPPLDGLQGEYCYAKEIRSYPLPVPAREMKSNQSSA